MSNFVKALETKIKNLRAVQEGHLVAIAAVEAKIELLEELLLEEGGELPDPLPVPAKKRPGRPKGSRNKKSPAKKPVEESTHAPADELYDEAMAQLDNSGEGGTTPEQQEKLTRKFVPIPRPSRELGAGIVAGTKKQVEAAQGERKTNATVSIDEGE